MTLLELIFWSAVLVPAYAYVAYPCAILLLARIVRSDPLPAPSTLPALTVVIPAHLEAAVLEEKIANTLSQQYPRESGVAVLVVTDAPDTETDEILGRHPSVRHLRLPERLGKAAALNAAMAEVRTPWVVLTDANAMLTPGSLLALARHFAVGRVGAVSGEKRVVGDGATDEGLYWRYESVLKRADAHVLSLVGAAGELLAVRTSLWRPIEDDAVLDDFVISMRIAIGGHKVAYEPRAVALERAATRRSDDWERRVRIAAGGLQSIARLPGAWNVLRRPVLCWMFVSHRVLRWTLVPASLAVAVAVLPVLALGDPRYLPVLIVAGVALVAAGLVLRVSRNLLGAPGRALAQFVMMHAAVFAGALRLLRGAQPAAWHKVPRERSG